MEDIRARISALADGNLPDHAGWAALIRDAGWKKCSGTLKIPLVDTNRKNALLVYLMTLM